MWYPPQLDLQYTDIKRGIAFMTKYRLVKSSKKAVTTNYISRWNLIITWVSQNILDCWNVL